MIYPKEYACCICKDKTAPENHLSWNSAVAQVDEAFEFINTSGIVCEDITVAVFDTGLYLQHSYFEPNRITTNEKYTLTIDGIEYDANEDGHYHGTHVAGIVYDNTMNNVKICPYRIYGDGTNWIPYSVYWTAFKAAIEDGVDVINISSIHPQYTSEEEEAFSPGESFSSLINEAGDNNIVVVAAAGNRSREIHDDEIPASFTQVITVSATTKDNLPDTNYSNYGKYVDIGAPGTGIYSTTPRTLIDNNEELLLPAYSAYMNRSGTSMATPLVAAAAATLKSINPDITPAEVERIIKETAYVPEGWDSDYGVGIVNFYNMVKAEVSRKPRIIRNAKGEYEIIPPEGSDARIYYSINSDIPTVDEHLLYSEPLSTYDLLQLNGGQESVKRITAVCHESGKLISAPVVIDVYDRNEITINYKETVRVMPESDAVVSEWLIQNPEIVSADEEGNITGESVGEGLITVVSPSGHKEYYNITVEYAWWQQLIRIFLLGFLWY